jgi:hypothetical protein
VIPTWPNIGVLRSAGIKDQEIGGWETLGHGGRKVPATLAGKVGVMNAKLGPQLLYKLVTNHAVCSVGDTAESARVILGEEVDYGGRQLQVRGLGECMGNGIFRNQFHLGGLH